MYMRCKAAEVALRAEANSCGVVRCVAVRMNQCGGSNFGTHAVYYHKPAIPTPTHRAFSLSPISTKVHIACHDSHDHESTICMPCRLGHTKPHRDIQHKSLACVRRWLRVHHA